MSETPFGTCSEDGAALQVSEWFIEREYSQGIPTGRVRTAASSLTCPSCLKNYVIDATFDSGWRMEK